MVMSLQFGGVGPRVLWFLAFALLVVMPTRVFAQELNPAAQTGRALVPLYMSLGVLQALDVHSTTRAIRAGGVEANPLMRGVAQEPGAMLAVKAGGVASTIWLTHKLAKRSKTGAFILMAAVNSAYAVVVANNYRAAR
jgi:hypothetical protein